MIGKLWLGFIKMIANKPKPVVLIVMRLDEMFLVHPDMTRDRVCSKCNLPVGVYPSGQKILAQYQNASIVCNRCIESSKITESVLAPGAIKESSESIFNSNTQV